MFHHRAFAQGGPAAFGSDLGAQFLLELRVLADMQAPPVPKLGVGALWAYQTRIAGTRRKLHSPPWGHRHRHATRTGDHALHKVQTKGVFGEVIPALGLGASNDVHALRSPLGNPRTRHVA
jgi:hypothetical protein